MAALFLKLGAIGFGGPAAHIAMMEREVVARRSWLSHEQFLDLLGATNLIPGPNSTEMAIHIGHRRAGFPGLIVAGLCFILPAASIVIAIAWAYARYGQLPQVEAILYGIKPVIIAIVVQALWKLGRVAVKTKVLAIVGLVTVALNLISGVNELLLLFGGAVVVAIIRPSVKREKAGLRLLLPFWPKQVPFLATAAAAGIASPFTVWSMFLVFLKIGSVLFGSGYVLLAFLRADFVEQRHWLTENQLLDAVAVGQFTPGPLFTTATFIGYLLGGWFGGVVATIGIFLPAFLFVAISGPLIPRIRRSPFAAALLDGVNVASLALMVAVTYRLGIAAFLDWLTLLLGSISAFFLFRYGISSIWLVVGGGVAGWLSSILRS